MNKEITLNDYKNCLFSGRQQLRLMNVIRSRHHEVFTEQVNKIALTADDDKGIILPDRIHSLAHSFQGWGQTERSKENRGTLGKTRGPGMGNSCAIFGKTERPWERIGTLGVGNSYAILGIVEKLKKTNKEKGGTPQSPVPTYWLEYRESCAVTLQLSSFFCKAN